MSNDDLNRLSLPAGWHQMRLVFTQPHLRAAPNGGQLLGEVEDVEGRTHGVGVWVAGRAAATLLDVDAEGPVERCRTTGSIELPPGRRARMRVPWSGSVEFDVGLAERLMVPSP